MMMETVLTEGRRMVGAATAANDHSGNGDFISIFIEPWYQKTSHHELGCSP